MAKAQKQQKAYAEQLQNKVSEGPSAFASQGAELQQTMQETANQGIQAQQKALKRNAMNSGPLMAGENAAQGQAMAQTVADAGVKSAGMAGDYQRKMWEAQQGVAMRAMETATAAELEKRKQNMELAGGVLEVAGDLVPTFA